LHPAGFATQRLMSDSFHPAPLVLILIWGRKGAFGDLAVDGGPRQSGAGENGFQADDTIWLTHGCAASFWSFLTIAETSESNELLLCNRYLGVVVVWRRNGGKWDGSTSYNPMLLPLLRP